MELNLMPYIENATQYRIVKTENTKDTVELLKVVPDIEIKGSSSSYYIIYKSSWDIEYFESFPTLKEAMDRFSSTVISELEK
jgi:hypothetical protein